MKLINAIFAPHESVNDEFLSLVNVYVKTGDFAEKNKLLAELETSKALVEVRSDHEGYVVVHAKQNSDVKVGSMMFEIFDSPIAEIANVEIKIETNGSVKKDKIDAHSETKFSKDALDYINKNNIDEKKFNGLAFVTMKDILPKEKNKSAKNEAKQSFDSSVKETNLSTKTNRPLSANKKREFEYLYSVNSSSVISRLSTIVVVNNKDNIGNAQNFIKSTPLPTIIHEVSKLLMKYPNLNSFYINGEQAFYNDIHVGFALDDGKNGLKVAAVLNTNELSLKAIEDSISELSLKYPNNQLTVQELTAATFTITDLFNTNVVSFHPLINSNNGAILGVSGFHNGEFIIDLSFDHRLTNGREVSQFLDDLKFRLENRFNSAKSNNNVENDIHCFKCLRDINDDLDGNLYFIKVANAHDNGYICSNCLKGW
jgi:pyruvate/2-oxoglutarate dehydrogenase complex dihydrolipoamide acyltransferase (E2) component